MNPFQTPTVQSKPSTLITLEQFSDAYSAVAFATRFGFPPSGHVTLHWKMLGVVAAKDVLREFDRFRRCVRDWLVQRNVPVVYIFSHENSKAAGLHTHFAVHIPVARRREFLEYVRGWQRQHFEDASPKGVKVTGMGADPVTVWRVFSYLMKGYDRSAVLVGAENHHSGRTLFLGDVIANVWRDPGAVDLRDRVGVSRAIAKRQRALGYIPGAEHLVSLPPAIPSSGDLFPSHEAPDAMKHTWTAEDGERVRTPTPPPPRPFRSKFEDGRFDVWEMYPPEFCRYVTQLDQTGRIRSLEEEQLRARVQQLETDNLILLMDLEELKRWRRL
jgi:hypothetical protein